MVAGVPGVSYSSLVLESLTRFPSREAFVFGERRLTYAHSLDITRRFMAAFESRGIGHGAAVALLSPNSPEGWLAQAAACLVGARYTGLQLLASLEDHVFVCDDAEVSVLIAAEAYADHAAEIKARAQTVKEIFIMPAGGGDQLDVPSPSGKITPGPAVEDDVAWLQYTGGTTGRRKGVIFSHRGMVGQTLSTLASCGVPENPRSLVATPITHSGMFIIVPTLLRGGTVVLMPAFDPELWVRQIQDKRINFTLAAPTMLYTVLDQARPEAFDLSSLETVIYSTSPMSPTRLHEAHDRIGPVFQQVYGQTETGAAATTLRKDEHDISSAGRLASCGRAVAGCEVRLLDDDGNEAATGDVGEISVRSGTVMAGYWKLPEETAAVMRDGWLRTGDMGRQDDEGFFYIVDRKKDMIISGGFNIYAREVEDVLTTHPAVAAAAVIGVPHDKWGEAVHCVIVTRPEATVDPVELTTLVKERKGPMYAPKTVEFVDSLPTTAVGKIDKKALRVPYWAGQDRQVH